ncbi:MAG TPA: porin family protein [Geobacteraceae bacterium]
MKCHRRIALLCAMVLLLTGTAGAESISGRFGVTARGGFQVPADGEFTSSSAKFDTDTGFAVGGGFIYGINNRLAAEVDVTYSQFDAKYNGARLMEMEVTNVSVGLQYRVTPFNMLVPYMGAGIDILAANAKPVDALAAAGLGATDLDVDTTVGGHVNAGVDLFLTPDMALNAEVRGVIGAESDIKYSGNGTTIARFDPTSVTGLFGIRYFFR